MSNQNPFDVLERHILSLKSEIVDLRQAVQSSSPASEKKYYTIEEAAKKLNVAEITLYRNSKKGIIPRKMIANRVMIPGSYVDGV